MFTEAPSSPKPPSPALGQTQLYCLQLGTSGSVSPVRHVCDSSDHLLCPGLFGI